MVVYNIANVLNDIKFYNTYITHNAYYMSYIVTYYMLPITHYKLYTCSNVVVM